ncbi:unnamed protein product, partial [Ectocarpus sp. 8 AP-2014]
GGGGRRGGCGKTWAGIAWLLAVGNHTTGVYIEHVGGDADGGRKQVTVCPLVCLPCFSLDFGFRSVSIGNRAGGRRLLCPRTSMSCRRGGAG